VTISGNSAATDGGGVDQVGVGSVILQVAKVFANAAPTDPDIAGTFTFV
jgi:hypothetical protein